MLFTKNIFKTVVFFTLLAGLSNCKLVETPPLPAAVQLPASFNGSTDSTSLADISWQTFFNDPKLSALIDVAIKNNLDLLTAQQRIEMARAGYFISRGTMLPAFDARFRGRSGNIRENLLNNTINGDRNSANQTQNYFLGFQSSWEADIWGKLKNRRKGAYARLLATEKGKRLVQTNLVAEVARLYYELLGLDYELETINKNVKLQKDALEIMKIQKLGGRATELAVKQFHAQLLRTQSLGFEKRQQIIENENQLNLLLGRYPQPIARGASILKQYLPTVVQAGIPSDMLLRRPDIQQAELNLLAAKADLEAARAEFLPSFVITPYMGFQNIKLPALLQAPETLVFGAIGGITAPLFNRNQIKSGYNQTVAQNLEGFYTYQRTILTGYQEVVTSLKKVENLNNIYRLREQETEVLAEAVSTANDLFSAGYASYLEIITAQESVLAAELNMTNTRKDTFLALINLYRALGGGWEES